LAWFKVSPCVIGLVEPASNWRRVGGKVGRGWLYGGELYLLAA